MTESSSAARAGFWDRGGFWKAVILATLYVALNFALGLTIGALFADSLDADDLLGDPLTLFLAVMLPTAVQGAVMAFIAWRLGWLRSLFRTQPTTLSRSWWMWILPIAVLVWNVLRLAATDYSRYTFTSIALILLLGLLIGFGEELTTRGLGVTLLRRAGYRELAVAVLSSLVFAAMHLGNIAGMDGLTVGITVFYTFFFGVAMYFTLRVTRNLVWPMLLHATTDPSAMLLTGGIDEATETASTSGLAAVAGLANFVVIGLGILLLWWVRGRVDRFREFGLGEPSGDAARVTA